MAGKHDDAVEDLIETTGKIKESSLYLKTFGFGEAMKEAVNMFKSGKFKYAFEKDSNVKNMASIICANLYILEWSFYMFF